MGSTPRLLVDSRVKHMSLNCSTSDAFRPKIWCHIGKSQHLFKGVSFSVRLTGVLHSIVVLYDIKNEIDV